jgi:uncharacterized protein (DUF58 family)
MGLEVMGDVWNWVNDYGSAIGAVAGVIAAFVAIVALVSAAQDSKARSQPMVAAEFRPAPDSDSSLDFIVTNLGPTPARDVRVEFSPPIALPDDQSRLAAPFLVERYARPIPVLNPGQILSNTWWAGEVGTGNELVNGEPTPDEVTVTLTYRGRGRRYIRDSYPLSVETVTLTTYSVSSTSLKGRLQSLDDTMKKIRDHLATIARK